MKIALLGATGYIGRSLLHELISQGDFVVTPFTRDNTKAVKLWNEYGVSYSEPKDYDSFLKTEFDVVINATGIGSPKKFSANSQQVFAITESMDELIFSYLKKYPKTRVFNLSSGAVYGKAVGVPITDETLASFSLINLRGGDFYSLAKLYSEIKHRAYPKYHFIDLRVFAFVSRFVDIEDSFFISELAKCLKYKQVFETTPTDMERDYSSAKDILDVIVFLYKKPGMNSVFDIQSLEPVSKLKLLGHLKEKFTLQVKYVNETNTSPTGIKNAYYSRVTALTKLGFKPSATSLQIIDSELRTLLLK